MTVQVHYVLVDRMDIYDGHVYRGIQRPRPDSESRGRAAFQQVVEQSWRDKEDSDFWCHFYGTLELARTYQQRYLEFGDVFECIAVYPCENGSAAKIASSQPGWLGFDVANTEFDSALHPAMIWRELDDQDAPRELLPFWRLYARYCRVRTNSNGLLASYEDASLVHDAVASLLELEPDFSYMREALVLGLVRVDPAVAS